MGTIKYYNDIIQGSPEWTYLRLGKIGSSGVKDIVDVKKKMKLKSRDVVLTAVAGVISEIETGFSTDSDFLNDAMEWGRDNEDDAKNIIRTKHHFDTGGVTNSDYKYAWLSPDMLSDSEGVEVKCFSSKEYAKNVIINKIPSKHLPQVLFYMAIIPDLDFVRFLMYDPRFRTKKYHEIIAFRKDYSEHITNMQESLTYFGRLVDECLKIFN